MKTTVELSPVLLRRAKRIAARDKVTLRALLEEGLASSLRAREAKAANEPCPPLPVFRGGRGMTPEFAAAGWERMRDELYEGRGA